MSSVGGIFDRELTPSERLLPIWGFVIIGLIVALQASQTQAENRLQWTRLTAENRLKWFATYLLGIFFLFQATYPMLRVSIAEYARGSEEQILNAIWIGLVSIETLLVVGVAVQGLTKRLAAAAPKQKTT